MSSTEMPVEPSELEMEDAEQVSNEEERPKPRKAGAGCRPRKVTIKSESDRDDSDMGESSDWDSGKPKKEKKAAAKKSTVAGKKTKLPAGPKESTKPEAGAGAGKMRGNISKAKGQKLIEDLFMPAPSNAMPQQEESSPAQKSPAQKVRRMRPSPFHKKSGSVTEKLAAEEKLSNEEEQVFEGPAGERPKRANRTAVHYVISDDDDEESAGDDHSDFDAAEEFE